MWAWSSGAKSAAKDAALVAPLLANEPRLTRWALVDDGARRQTGAQAELALVGRSLAETEAALAAGIRAIGLAPTRVEVVPAR